MIENNIWGEKLDYLQSTRLQFWNDDYLEFLVKNVWNIDQPKNIVDFGCGYGYLGLKLLPLLPSGCTYTGIDIADSLLEEAQHLYHNSPYIATFIKADLLSYKPTQQYDIAICQAFLRHTSDAKGILKKMVDSVRQGGMVICIEVNRRMENAGLYIDDPDYDVTEKDAVLFSKLKKELKNGERDYMTGIKVPIYMEQLGLEQVNVRLNDFVEYVSPSHENYSDHLLQFLENNIPFYKTTEKEQKRFLLARSLLIYYGIKGK